MAALIEVFEARVRVEKHLFALVDSECDVDDVYEEIPAEGLLAREDVVVFSSSLEDQYAHTRVELWDGHPEAPEGQFRPLGPASLVRFSSGLIRIVNLYSEPESEEWDIGGNTECKVQGFIVDADSNDQPDGEAPSERYVVQIWRP